MTEWKRAEFLPFAPPFLGEEEVAEVTSAIQSGWVTRGPRTGKFEAAFAERLGAPGALGLNSCTAGLHLALKALDVGPGDEVVTTTMTFSASVNVIEHVGARPVLVDVEPDTLNLSAEAVADALTERTAAVIVVHYAGHPVDMDSIQAVCDGAGVPIIEDAAHALPARYRGRTIGASDNLTAFSFYATKNLTTGEGGMLTGPADLLKRARVLSLHGMTDDAWARYSPGGSWRYEVVEPGFKYNMTDIQASMGLCQLAKLDLMQERRRSITESYMEAFGDLEQLELPAVREDVEPAWHLFYLRLRLEAMPVDRARFIDEMRAMNIGTSVHFIPVHIHPYYERTYGYRPGDFPVADDAFDRLVSLPLHPGLSEEDVAYVVRAVRSICTA